MFITSTSDQFSFCTRSGYLKADARRQNCVYESSLPCIWNKIILGKSWLIYSCLFNKLLVRYVPLAITFLILFLTLVQFHLRCRNWYWHSDWANVTPSVMVCNKPGAFLQMSTNFGRLRRLFLHICFGLSTKSLPEVLYKKKTVIRAANDGLRNYWKKLYFSAYWL